MKNSSERRDLMEFASEINPTDSEDEPAETTNPLGQECQLCSLFFDTPEQLFSHELSSHKFCAPKYPSSRGKLRYEYKFRCDDCDMIFLKWYEYEAHANESKCDATSLTYICRLCLNELNSKEERRRHRCVSCFMCDSCNRAFTTKLKLIKHIDVEHQIVLSKRITYACETENPLGLDCEHCTLKFDTPKQLFRHKLSIHKSMKRTCMLCKRVFFSLKKLTEHSKIHRTSRKKTFKCSSCKRFFGTRRMLAAHERTHVNETTVLTNDASSRGKLRYEYKFRCNDCKTVYLKRYEYEAHAEGKECDASSLTYICKLCLKELNSNEERRRHRCESSFTCKTCNCIFPTVLKLNKHIATGHRSVRSKHVTYACDTTNPLGQDCELCATTFETPEQLINHKLSIHKSEKRSCALCKRVFFGAQQLAEHSKSHETSRKNTLKCSDCKRFFFSRKMLAAHERTHTIDTTISIKHPSAGIKIRYEYKYRCNDCETTFLKRYEYNAHAKKCDATSLTYICRLCLNELNSKEERRGHRCESCFICNSCNCVFTTKLQLIKHIAVVHHSAPSIQKKTRPAYWCMQCDLHYTNATDLKEHNASTTHGALSLYSCKVCQRTFADKDKLKKHTEAHAIQIASFKHPCNYCPMKFKLLKQLLAHYASTHRDIRPYECAGCGEKFKLRSQFACHIRFYHKGMGRMKLNDNLIVFTPDDPSKCVAPPLPAPVEKSPPKLLLVTSKTSGRRITTRPPPPLPITQEPPITVKPPDESNARAMYLKLNINKNLEISKKSIIKRISSEEASLKRKMDFSGEPIARPQKATKSNSSFMNSFENFVIKSNLDNVLNAESLFDNMVHDGNTPSHHSDDSLPATAPSNSFDVKNTDGQTLLLVNVNPFKNLTTMPLQTKNSGYKKKTFDCMSIIEKELNKGVAPETKADCGDSSFDDLPDAPSSSFDVTTGDGKVLHLINVNPFKDQRIKLPKPRKSDYKPKTYDCLAIIEKGLKFESVSKKKGKMKKTNKKGSSLKRNRK